VKLKCLSEVYPHPDLQLNESNVIISGSLEAICHTILFNTLDDDKLSYNLLLVLPLFGDIKICLKHFIEYANVVVTQGRMSRSAAKIVVSNNTDYAITQRLGLVVTTIVDSFPGMLLDNEIIELLGRLLGGIALHDERLSLKLKLDLNQCESNMKNFTNFRTIPYNPHGSENLNIVENFLKMDSNLIATQINIIDLKFNSSWNPKSDPSLLYELENLSYSRINPLIFNSSTNIHYLGRLIVNHLFGVPDPKHGEAQRAKVLEKWIEIGCIFDKIGDMVSWLAIATVICSTPVLRLKKTWTLVDETFMKIISSEWAPVVFELDRRNMISEASHRSSYHVIAPQGLGQTYSKKDVVPYFGDLTVKYVENSTLKQCEKKVQRVKISFSRWDEYLSNLKEEDSLLSTHTKVEDETLQRELLNLLTKHVSLEPLTLQSVMELSLCSETDAFASLEAVPESRTPLITGSYFPTLFTEVFPSYKLFAFSTLVGAGGFHKDGSRLSVSEQKAHMQSLKDTFNFDSDNFHVDDDLIFKSIISNTKLGESHRSSILVESPSLQFMSASDTRHSRLAAKKQDQVEANHGTELDDDVFAVLDSSDVLNSLIKPLNVVLKAGDLSKMVDILVLTSNVFSRKIDKGDTERFLQKSNLLDNQFLKLKMDSGVYTSTFFATYKSFTTTPILLGALSRRFIGAKSAAISIAKLNSEPGTLFPSWDSRVSSDDASLNWNFVGNIQIGVLEAIAILVTDHYADFTNDLKNKQIFVDLLRTIDNEIMVEWRELLLRFEDANDPRNDLNDIYNRLSNLYKEIRKTFIKKCYRPLDVFPITGRMDSLEGIVALPLPGEFREAEIFVERLDYFIHDLFNLVSTSDWIHVSHLLESHTGKSLVSFFKYSLKSATDDKKLEILNVFSWIKSLYGENMDDSILKKFPPPLQTLFEVHDNLEKYIKLQITDLQITRKDRNARMAAILQMLTITKLRMNSVKLFNGGSSNGSQSPVIPSFIETAITQAIVSPESRSFDASWVLFAGNGSCDNISDLLLDVDVEDLAEEYRGSLTPCPGWFIGRLMEILNLVPSLSSDNKLINFDKRRFTYNCISNITDLPSRSINGELEHSKKDFGFLLDFNDVPNPQLDEVLLVANDESQSAQSPLSLIFKSLLDSEFEKIKRDTLKREDLENQERDLKRIQLLNQATRVSMSVNREMPPPNEPPTMQRRGRQSNSSPTKTTGMKRFGGLFKSVRPFSISVGSGWSGPDKIVHPDDLPDVRNVDLSGKHSKPYQQIRLFNYKPLFVHTNIEGFFKMVSENGGEEFFFQALNNTEAQSWMSALNISKRYTYLSKDTQGLTSSKVFGVPISDVCEREGTLIPLVVEKLLAEIELRGLDETGLYRIPGSVGSINLLRQAFDAGNEVSLNEDIHTLGGCFKAYLRDLPENLLTNELLPDFVACTKQGDLQQNLKILVRHLPVHNYHVLKRLFNHLHKVVQHSEHNRMDAVNLAIVFSMSFINNDNLGSSMGSDLGALQGILQCLIKDPDAVFTEQEDEVTVYAA
jgi:hypothetical protein